MDEFEYSKEEIAEAAAVLDEVRRDRRPNGEEREMHRTYENAKGRYAAGQMNVNIVIVGGVPKWLTNFDELSEQFALLQAPGLPSVYISRPDVLPIHESDLKRRLESCVVQTGTDKDGRPVYLAAFKYWIGHARRHLYRRIVFTNRTVSDDDLNIYKGLGVAPKEGEISRILAHIREVICADSEKEITRRC